MADKEAMNGRATIAFWILIALGVGAVVVSFVSLWIGGIGWDSGIDTETGLAFSRLTPGVSLPEAYAAIPKLTEFYGVFVQQAANVLFNLAGGVTDTGSIGTLQPSDPWTYRYQGIVVILLSLVSVSAMAVSLGLALKSRLAGALFWSLTLSTPLWLGMTHVNFKDVPVAAGLTMLSAGLILAQVDNHGRGRIPASIAIGGVGASITLAGRPGSIVIVLALCLGVALVAMVHGKLVTGRLRESFPVFSVAGLSLVAGLSFLLLTHPIAQIEPVSWIADAATTAQEYPWEGTILTAGIPVSSLDIPLWYVPVWLLAQLPLLTLAALVSSLGFVGWCLFRNPALLRSRSVPTLSPLFIQGLVIPALIVVSGSVLYDGIRHLLFMIPALLALIPVTVSFLLKGDRVSERWLRLIAPASVVMVAFSLFASARWMPYSYAFINPIAGLSKEAWELDYWGVSAREGVVRLRELGYRRVLSLPWPDPGIPWGAEESTLTGTSATPTAGYFFRRTGLGADYFGCRPLFKITRDGLLLGEGAVC